MFCLALGIIGCLVTLYYLILVSGYRTEDRTSPYLHGFDTITTESGILLTAVSTMFMLFLGEKIGYPLIHLVAQTEDWSFTERMLRALIIYGCCMVGAFSMLRRYKPIKKTDFGDMLHRMYERLEAKIGQAAYYQVLDGYARGLVGEEEVKHVVSSVQPVNVAQRPGVLAKEGEQSPTKIVRDALYYIRRHYNENISLTDVAEHINVNKSYLCDVFKKEQKVTILQYMTNLRIEKAKELLLHTDMKMYEISVEVGYNDYTYFSQIFKRNTGETLSEFRKKAGSKK